MHRKRLSEDLREYSKGFTAYQIGSTFQDLLCEAADIIESRQTALDAVTKERDAAVKCLRENPSCDSCAHFCKVECNGRFCIDCDAAECICKSCIVQSNWEWRGI